MLERSEGTLRGVPETCGQLFVARQTLDERFTGGHLDVCHRPRWPVHAPGQRTHRIGDADVVIGGGASGHAGTRGLRHSGAHLGRREWFITGATGSQQQNECKFGHAGTISTFIRRRK